MAKEFTDKQRFKSKYAVDTYVTGAQYLAEFMCERIAKKEGVQLPVRFWQLPHWKKVFQLQVLKANEWLKEYDISLILKGMRSPAAAKIYSLGFKSGLKPIFERQRKIEANKVPEQVNIIEESNIMETPRPTISRRNTLRDLN